MQEHILVNTSEKLEIFWVVITGLRNISILLIIVAVIALILMWKNAMKAREIVIRMAIKTSCTALHLDRRGFAWNIEDIKDTAQSRINRHDFQLTTRHPTDVDILIKIQCARIARGDAPQL